MFSTCEYSVQVKNDDYSAKTHLSISNYGSSVLVIEGKNKE